MKATPQQANPAPAPAVTRGVAFVEDRSLDALNGVPSDYVVAMEATMPERVAGGTKGAVPRVIRFRVTNVSSDEKAAATLNVGASETHGPGIGAVPALEGGASATVTVTVQPAFGQLLMNLAGQVKVQLAGRTYIFDDSVSFHAPTLRSEQLVNGPVRVLLAGPPGGGKSSLAVTAATLMTRAYGMSWATPTGGQAKVTDPTAVDGDASHTTVTSYVSAGPFLFMDGPGAASTWQSKGKAAKPLPLLQLQVDGVAARGMSMEDLRGLSDAEKDALRETASFRKPHAVIFCAPARQLLSIPLDDGIKSALDFLRDATPLIAAMAIDDDLMPPEYRVTADELGTAKGLAKVEELRLAIAERTRLDGQTVHPVISYTELDMRRFAVDLRVFALLEAVLSLADDKEAQGGQAGAEDWRKYLE